MFFVFVVVVHMFVLKAAFTNHPGFIEKDPYEKGLAYEQVITKQRNALNLGVKAELVVSKADHSGLRLVTATIRGPQELVSGSDVELELVRPSEKDLDTKVKLLAVEQSGLFRAQARMPLQGLWLCRLHIFTPQGKELLIEKRILAP